LALAIQLHSILANAVSIFTALITLFALFLLITRRPVGGDFWGAIVIGEILIVAHTISGIVAALGGAAPARTVHFLYGAVAVITWPAIFAFTQSDDGPKHTILYWVLGSAFLFGVSLRAAQTARHVLEAALSLLN